MGDHYEVISHEGIVEVRRSHYVTQHHYNRVVDMVENVRFRDDNLGESLNVTLHDLALKVSGSIYAMTCHDLDRVVVLIPGEAAETIHVSSPKHMGKVHFIDGLVIGWRDLGKMFGNTIQSETQREQGYEGVVFLREPGVLHRSLTERFDRAGRGWQYFHPNLHEIINTR